MRNTAFVSPEHSEADLVAGAKRGDETAIRTIVRLQNQTLFRLARSIVSDQDAEDAVQEAYLRAFRDIGGFRGESSLKTWLGRIVVNAALERLRRERPDHVIPFPPPTLLADPERTMAHDQIRHMLEQAIDELPPAFRGVVVARLLEEMSVEETAQILGLKPETVKTRLFRARVLLRAAVVKRLGAALGEAFPFGDLRCQRMADRVVAKLREPFSPPCI